MNFLMIKILNNLMIISKTPYRLSFFGGGTDYPQWYLKNGGKVISSTLNYHSYILLRKLPQLYDYNYKLRYFEREEIKNVKDIRHPVIKNLFKIKKIDLPLDVIHHGDLPARTGIGSSSAFTVGMIKSINEFFNNKTSKKELASYAINFEQNILKENVGSQDQIACTYGGFNKIIFQKNGDFIVKNIKISKNKIKILEENLVLVHSGVLRDSSLVSMKNIQSILNNLDLSDMTDLVDEFEKLLLSKSNKNFINDFSYLLNEQSKIKEKMGGKTNCSEINEIVNRSFKLGASASKVIGAGEGGLVLIVINKDKQQNYFNKINRKYINVQFSHVGSHIIHKNIL